MARGRMIDKVIILSKKLNAVSEGAENLYYRIYVNTDDFGRFHADPKILKGQIYTLRNISSATIEKRLNELIKIGLFNVYKNDDEYYLEIVGFEKHQTFRKDYVRKHEFPTSGTKSNEVVRIRHANINKDNINKIKINENKSILKSTIEKEFNKLWKAWPKEGRFDSKHCLMKFEAIVKQGKLKLFKKISNGYLQYLEDKRVNDNFPQKAKHLKTWMNSWEGEREQFENFKFEQPL